MVAYAIWATNSKSEVRSDLQSRLEAKIKLFLFVVRNFQETETKCKLEVLNLLLTTNQFLQNSSKILKSVSKNPKNSNHTIPSMSATTLLGPNLVWRNCNRDFGTFIKWGKESLRPVGEVASNLIPVCRSSISNLAILTTNSDCSCPPPGNNQAWKGASLMLSFISFNHIATFAPKCELAYSLHPPVQSSIIYILDFRPRRISELGWSEKTSLRSNWTGYSLLSLPKLAKKYSNKRMLQMQMKQEQTGNWHMVEI